MTAILLSILGTAYFVVMVFVIAMCKAASRADAAIEGAAARRDRAEMVEAFERLRQREVGHDKDLADWQNEMDRYLVLGEE